AATTKRTTPTINYYHHTRNEASTIHPGEASEVTLPTTKTTSEINEPIGLKRRYHASAARRELAKQDPFMIEDDTPLPIPIPRTSQSVSLPSKSALPTVTDIKKPVLLKVSGADPFASYNRDLRRKSLFDDVDQSLMNAVELQSTYPPKLVLARSNFSGAYGNYNGVAPHTNTGASHDRSSKMSPNC
ncbi:hypothetical protein COOONC_23649, partial [Cooperia oncophora]